MRALTVLLLGLVVPLTAHAAVLCAKPSRAGTFNGSNVKVRETCKPSEVQLSPDAVDFCCSAATSTSTTITTTTSSSQCPTFTTTTNTLQNCGNTSGFCGFGICANARACVPGAGGVCECTGDLRPCGIVSTSGNVCGGTCPDGFTCSYFSSTGTNGCPTPPRCGCTPAP